MPGRLPLCCPVARADQDDARALPLDLPSLVASLSSFIGVDGANATLNAGRMLINLKPKAERDVESRNISNVILH